MNFNFVFPKFSCCLGISIFTLLFSFSIYAHSIVFVHLGERLPKHLPTAIAQARLFNKECPIYLIANTSALKREEFFLKHNVISIQCESLPCSAAHRNFRLSSRHDKINSNGYWFYTVERFFYLDEFITANHLSNVVHLENDVMIYENLDKLFLVFEKNYSGMIGATFENDNRCCAGLLYISNSEPMNRLMEFFADQTTNLRDAEDMHMIGLFKELYKKKWIDYLPTVLPEYANDSTYFQSKEPESYFNHFDEFSSLFDAAALGIYLGGIDPHFHLDSGPGKDWPHSIMKPSHFDFVWERDSEGRKVPFMIYNKNKIRVNNLHITCKNLDLFSSF